MFSLGDDNDNNKTHAASPYGHAGGTTATAVAIGDTNNAWTVGEKQPKRCNDPIFGGLFYINIAAIVGLIAHFGVPAFDFKSDDNDNNNNNNNNNNDGTSKEDILSDYTGLIKIAICAASFSAILSGIALQFMLCMPGVLIKVALIFNVVISGLVVVYGIVSKQYIAAVIGFVFFALMLCYARLVWSRIPFATANLKTACASVRANCGLSVVAYTFTIISLGWSILWAISFAIVQNEVSTCDDQNGDQDKENCANPNYGYLFLLFLSFFFTQEVLKNSIHCTIAGTVGSWWIEPATSGFCSEAVCGSLFRTLTYSFGSICMGSLLVALIQAVRQLAETARQNEEFGAVIACCVDCILGCLESIIQYFNKWAFVYVGLYGYGYCQAGKSVIQLFQDRGWEAIIADDLVGMVLFMMSLITGLLTGAFSIGVKEGTSWFDNNAASGAVITGVVFVIGLVIGFVICNILMSVVGSAVNTVLVLFAEKPAEFERNHRELSSEMRTAFLAAYPGSL